MIKLEHLQGHDDMCGGYSYSGYATFEGRTVKEVLEEIRELSNKSHANWIGEGFGNPDITFGNCWGITIGGIRYVGGWIGWENKYNHQYDDRPVKSVRVSGGWYCWYDFEINI